jgi:hypothetical protein
VISIRGKLHYWQGKCVLLGRILPKQLVDTEYDLGGILVSAHN